MRFKFWKTCSLISLAFAFHAYAQDQQPTESEPAGGDDAVAEEAQQPPAETPAVVAPAAEAPHPDIIAKPTTQILREKEASRIQREKRIFGSYDLNIAMNRPKFTDQNAIYQKFYGTPSDYFSFGVDWFPIDWFATIGFGAKIGFYTDSGKTSSTRKSSDDPDGTNVTIKDDSSTTLLTYPIQLLAKIQGTPFRKKYVKLAGWGGLERNYWRETKKVSTDDSSTTKTTDAQQPLSTGGYKDAIVIGGAVHILLNYLDEESVNSMQGTMGIGSVYLSPYYEIVKQRQTEGLNLSRQTIGLGFTFESVR